MKRTIRVADSMSDWTMLVMTPALLLLAAAAAAAAAAAVAAAVSQVVSRILRHRRNRDGSFDIVIVGEGTFVIETISATAVPDEYGGAACPPLAHGTFVASVSKCVLHDANRSAGPWPVDSRSTVSCRCWMCSWADCMHHR
jgi:hypothetical protein